MLKYDYRLGMHILDGLIVVSKNGNTSLVVVRSRLLSTLTLGKPLGEVEAETINMVFTEQILQVTLHMIADFEILVVPVVEHAIGMRSRHVEPRIVGCGAIICGIPIESCHGVSTRSVIVHHIEDDSYAATMTLVDELLIHLARAIGLVHSKVGTRVIAPAEVTVELLRRHQFYGIDTQLLQIVELDPCPLEVLGRREVTQKQFIDNKVIGIAYLKVLDRPRVGRSLCLEGGHVTRGLCGIGRHVGIGGRRDPLVISRIYHLCIGISNTNSAPCLVVEVILESIFLARSQSLKRTPPAASLLVTLHDVGALALPIAVVTDDIGIVVTFAIGILLLQHEGHRGIIDVVDARHHSSWEGSLLYFIIGYLVRIILYGAEEILRLFRAIGIAHYNTNLVYHLIGSGTEPLTNGGSNLEFPYIILVGRDKTTLLQVGGPIGLHMHPLMDNNTDMHIERCGKATERILASSPIVEYTRFIGLGHCIVGERIARKAERQF